MISISSNSDSKREFVSGYLNSTTCDSGVIRRVDKGGTVGKYVVDGKRDVGKSRNGLILSEKTVLIKEIFFLL